MLLSNSKKRYCCIWYQWLSYLLVTLFSHWWLWNDQVKVLQIGNWLLQLKWLINTCIMIWSVAINTLRRFEKLFLKILLLFSIDLPVVVLFTSHLHLLWQLNVFGIPVLPVLSLLRTIFILRKCGQRFFGYQKQFVWKICEQIFSSFLAKRCFFVYQQSLLMTLPKPAVEV